MTRTGAIEAAMRVRQARGGGRSADWRAAIGVVLGTGMGGLVERLDDSWSLPGVETGWLAPSRATGHAGRIACGTVGGVPVAMLQGRVHGYEGHPPEMLTRGVELLAALGARTLLLTNASGGLRPDMKSGELVIVSDHVDLVRRPWDAALGGPQGESDLRPTRRLAGPAYDPALVEIALEATRRAGVVARRGVYALLSGPTYETRAEYRMLRAVGADVVGMSTVPEVVAGRRLGLEVTVCSVVTNVATPDAPTHTDAEDVCQMAADAAVGVAAILDALAARAARQAA
jgi:purine-nucleoside phosphorylase